MEFLPPGRSLRDNSWINGITMLAGTLDGNAKSIIDGYLITSANDTAKCGIVVHDLELIDKITIVDSAGKEMGAPSSRSIIFWKPRINRC